MDNQWSDEQLKAHHLSKYKEEIYSEQVKQLYALVPFGLVATFLNSLIIFFVLESVMPKKLLYVWLAAIMIISVLRIDLTVRFRKADFKTNAAPLWGNRFMVGLAASGLAWGSIGLMPFSEGVSLAYQVFIAFVLGGMAAGAAATFSVSKNGYLAYSIPALLPLTLRFFSLNDIFHYAMGGMLVIYGLFLWRISHRHYMVNTASMLLRFENVEMIDQLRSANDDIEKLNKELIVEINAKMKVEAELRAYYDRLEALIEERTRELRQSEALALEQSAALNALINAMPAGVLITRDPHCISITGNPAGLEIIGVITEQNIALDVPDGDRPHIEIRRAGEPIPLEQLPLHVACATGKPVMDDEIEIIRADGVARQFYCNAVPLFDSNGAVNGAIGVLLDITERKKFEKIIKRYYTELERSNRELDSFASIAAHDLRAPLRAVGGFAALLKKHFKNNIDEDSNMYISNIQEGVNRMQHLIDDLLAYARAGKSEKPRAHVDLGPVLEKVLTNLSGEIAESGAKLTVGPLPTVSADSTQLVQLFQNLVGNAIKYRRTAPQIDISAEKKAGEWLFSVSDNGIGIDPQHFERIFEIFQRLHATDEYSGTGIGLAICKKIVERLGGRIWVESKPGEGSTFFFTLPVME